MITLRVLGRWKGERFTILSLSTIGDGGQLTESALELTPAQLKVIRAAARDTAPIPNSARLITVDVQVAP